MIEEYPGSVEVSEETPDADSIIIDEEEYDVSVEITDDVAIFKLDNPLELKLVYDGEPLEDTVITLDEFEVGYS